MSRVAQKEEYLSVSLEATVKKLESAGWQVLGRGSYNLALIYHRCDLELVEGSSYRGPWVLKIPITINEEQDGALVFNALDLTKNSNHTDHPERAVRIMREVYPDLPCGFLGLGWVMPFISGGDAFNDDRDTAEETLRIYRVHGRLGLDFCGKDNAKWDFGLDWSAVHERIRIIDLGLARRRGSIASDLYWNDKKSSFTDYWGQYRKAKPKTVAVIEALNYLEDCMPEVDHRNKAYLQMTIMPMLIHAKGNKVKITEDLLKALVSLSQAKLFIRPASRNDFLKKIDLHRALSHLCRHGCDLSRPLYRKLYRDKVQCELICSLKFGYPGMRTLVSILYGVGLNLNRALVDLFNDNHNTFDGQIDDLQMTLEGWFEDSLTGVLLRLDEADADHPLHLRYRQLLIKLRACQNYDEGVQILQGELDQALLPEGSRIRLFDLPFSDDGVGAWTLAGGAKNSYLKDLLALAAKMQQAQLDNMPFSSFFSTKKQQSTLVSVIT